MCDNNWRSLEFSKQNCKTFKNLSSNLESTAFIADCANFLANWKLE